MITLYLDKHDYISAIEGFAHGSHLRQHIWQEMVNHHICQMNEEERMFVWYILRRNLWDGYMKYDKYVPCGAEDYLHALAALHLNNYATVKFNHPTMGEHEAKCYRFNNTWYAEGKFNSHVPEEWIDEVRWVKPIENTQMTISDKAWWDDLEVYNVMPRCK